MKKITLLFAMSLMFCFTYAQTKLIMVKPVGSKTWKYANIKGEIVINCEYPESYSFSEDGVAPVYYPKKNQYLLINAKGEELNTEIQNFTLKDAFGYGAKGFSDGLVAVMVNKKWGYMNTEGELAVPLKYDNLSEFHDGYGIGRTGSQFYVVDGTGKEIPVEDGITDAKEFSENLAPFTSVNEMKGFINTAGKIAIPAQFRSVGFFTGGIAWAKNTDNLTGFINTKGEWVIKPEFANVKEFDKESGLARVKKGESWMYVNAKGETISFNISDVTDDFYEGMAKGKKNNLLGFHNNKGEWVIEPQFEGVRDFKNGYAGAKSGGLWGVIDKQGNWVIKPMFAGVNDVVVIK